MNRRLMMNLKKATLCFLIATCSAGVILPVPQMRAATVSEVSGNKIVIGDTTITLGELIFVKGIDETAISVVIDRQGGFPKGAEAIELEGKGSVTIEGKKLDFTLGGTTLDKVSETQAKGRFCIFLEEWNKEVDKLFKLDKLKGQKMDISISDIEYQAPVTKVSNQFIKLLKNVQVATDVVPAKRGYGKELGGFLPVKNLNVPVLDTDDSPLIDNIGFVGDRLQITMNQEQHKLCMIGFKDSTGKKAESDPMTCSDNGQLVATFKIKNMDELAKYTPICEDLSTIATDKGQAKLSYIGK